jgi:hypothetical protein
MMLFIHKLPALLALSSFSLALPSPGSHSWRDAGFKMSVFEKLAGPPVGWVKDDAAKIDKSSSQVKLRIHLVQQGMDKFHDVAIQVLEEIFFIVKIDCTVEGELTLIEIVAYPENNLLFCQSVESSTIPKAFHNRSGPIRCSLHSYKGTPPKTQSKGSPVSDCNPRT